MKDGDANTKFFHQSALDRKRVNTITGLFDEEGRWCQTDQLLERVVVQYFEGLFKSSKPRNFDQMMESIQCVISDEINASLTREIEGEEIYSALKQMQPSKSSGPDGFSLCFYQTFWGIVGADIIVAVKCFLASKDQMASIYRTYVTLIPKVPVPNYMSQLRPISLCNVLYKIGSKVLANRLKPIMDRIISPFQGAFVPGRLIFDNSILAFEIVHCMKRRRSGKKGFCALKLDMSKAYDRVEWLFLEKIMRRLGLCDVWVRQILRCVSTASYYFLLNGTPRGLLYSRRGLR